MAEYIDRVAVETMLENAQIITDGEYCGYCTEDVNLNEIPAANVAEVRHGRWVEASDGDGVVCSECGTDFCTMIHETEKFRFCPNCGARMDKEDEHEVD